MPLFSEKASLEGKGLRYKLVIIESLVFALPFLLVTYIFYRTEIFEELTHLVIFAMILLLVLAGLIILRQVFDRFFAVAAFIKKAAGGEAVTMGFQKDTAELHDISLSFNNLVEKMQHTTDELSRRVLELFIIKELTEIANQKTDVESLLIALLNKAMAATKARIGSVFMVESAGDRLRLVGSRGPGGGLKKDILLSTEDSLMKFVVRERTNLLVQDVENDPRTLRRNNPKYGAPSFLSMPLFIGDRVSAVINLAHKETKTLFDADDEQILSIMLGEISFAVENAHLRKKIEEYVKELEGHAASLEREIVERRRIEEILRESEKNYRELSITDSLTGLYNRRHFFHQLRSEIERTNRYNHPLAILLLDIDNFKAYNDAFGHPEGDKVLVWLAEVISVTIRKTDSAYRYGGEEFVVLLPETPGKPAEKLAERILSQFKGNPFHPTQSDEIHVTASIGIAEYVPGEELTDLLKRADESMYQAKKLGKDRVYFQDSMGLSSSASPQKPLAID